MSNSLQPHGLQHARVPCPSPSPGACSNLCPLSQWYHPTISSSFVIFSSCLQPFPASGSFPMSQFFTSDGESITAPASAPALPMNVQGWFSLGLTGLISLLSKGLSRVFPSTTIQKHQFFCLPYGPTHIRTWLLDVYIYEGQKVMIRILSGVMVVGDAGIRALAFTAIGTQFTVERAWHT